MLPENHISAHSLGEGPKHSDHSSLYLNEAGPIGARLVLPHGDVIQPMTGQLCKEERGAGLGSSIPGRGVSLLL